jgi:hypothetical protein
MSPFFDELESQLRSAAKGVADAQDVPRPRPRRRRWWPAGMDLAPVLATVIVVVLIVGAALVLLRSGRPQPTPPSASPPPHGGLTALLENTPRKQLRREFSYIAAAIKPALESSVCQATTPPGPTFVHGTPDRSLLSILGILRRPATPADRLSASVFAGMSDVYAGSARHAFSAGGESYYLAVAGFDQAQSEPSPRCSALERSAFARYLPKIPPALRAQTSALEAGLLTYSRHLLTGGPRDGICVIDTGRSDNGTSCGNTAAEIKDGSTPDDANGVFVGVVPDGVASVTLAFPAHRGTPAHSVHGTVRGNMYAIRVPGAPEPPIEPTVTWHSADGHVIKTIANPTLAQERAACRANPVPCALIQDGGLIQISSSSSSSTVTAAGSAPAAH